MKKPLSRENLKVRSGTHNLVALHSSCLIKKTLGKMKLEYEGDNQICLTSKSYFCEGETNKQVCKGVSIAQNPLTFDQYVRVLEIGKPLLVENRGFRSKNITNCFESLSV